MKKILYLFSLLTLFSCAEKELPIENSDSTIQLTRHLVEKDGVVYPSTDMKAMTRLNYNDTDVDWVNGTKVTLPNGMPVDFPWVDGGSLPFYMQEKLSPNNGWELIAHTMAPDAQPNRAYLLFHNYVTGSLRVFCYMSTFATNNNGYWKILFEKPTRLLNFTSQIAKPMDEYYRTEIVVSNSTKQDGGGFALGWNGFQLELAYDPDATGKMQIMAMNLNTTETEMHGNYNSTTIGTIVSNSSSSGTASTIISGIGKIAGSSAVGIVEGELPFIKNIPIIGNGLLSLVKSGVSSIFDSFSGLFDEKTQEIKDVNLTTTGSVRMKGISITPAAAPVEPVNIQLELIDGKLGGWNIEEKPVLKWCTTVYNDNEVNRNVTDRQYFFQSSGFDYHGDVYYALRSNPKNVGGSEGEIIMNSSLPFYKNQGNMDYGTKSFYVDNDLLMYDDKYKRKRISKVISTRFRVRICMTEFPTSEGLPQLIELPEAKDRYTVREYADDRGENMNLYMQVTRHSTQEINGVKNVYCGTRVFECKSDWGDAY